MQSHAVANDSSAVNTKQEERKEVSKVARKSRKHPAFSRLFPANYQYYKERLDDVTLLERAVPVSFGSDADIAVPVGGKRRGGFLDLDDPEWCREVARQLRGRPGFPDVRIAVCDDETGASEVQWGDPQPGEEADFIEMGRYFGYSEQAIRRFLEMVDLVELGQLCRYCDKTIRQFLNRRDQLSQAA